MKLHTNHHQQPACKFGPGGDFLWVWPDLEHPELPGGWAGLVTTLAEVIAASTGFGGEAARPTRTTVYPRPSAMPASQQQSLLFPEDNRTVRPRWQHSRHRIRPHHRPVAKKPAEPRQQPTLFETALPNARTA